MQEVVILQPHTGGRFAADMLRGLCILQWRASCPLWQRISGFFHRILDPDFPPIILRRRKHLRRIFYKSRWYKGVCAAIKKPVSEGWTGAIKQNGVVDRTRTGDLLGHNDPDLSVFICFWLRLAFFDKWRLFTKWRSPCRNSMEPS